MAPSLRLIRRWPKAFALVPSELTGHVLLQIEKEAKRLIRAIDKNGDGNIAMDEFRKHYESKAEKARKFAANQAKKNASPSK